MLTTVTAQDVIQPLERHQKDRFWADSVIAPLSGPQIVNDSKTPSGRVHVGALRGVLIHDAVYRTLKERGLPASYLFGSDDYDPFDEVPPEAPKEFSNYLGVPLCNVPPPPRSTATDMADHYMGEFLQVFRRLGVASRQYRMRDLYRSGDLNEEIDRILTYSSEVREIYWKVSRSKKPADWHPFHVICENCGKLATTRVTSYNHGKVTYICESALLQSTAGCGYAGDTSPFGGKGKLPWKLEWAARWHKFGVTIEGAGKDHSTPGGSRAVAAACLQAVFAERAPLHIPYEFFLVGGSKMSSSHGIGVAAKEMVDFLPAELIRFLIIRTNPRSTVDFSPSAQKIVRLFDDYDLSREQYCKDTARPSARRIYELSQVHQKPEPPYWAPPFAFVLSIVQLPHVDPIVAGGDLKGSPLTTHDLRHLNERINAARYWLDHFALPEDRLILQPHLPASVYRLSPAQRWFLHELADELRSARWQPDLLQKTIFDVARRVPLDQPSAFQALYRVLFDRDSGPKVGNVLHWLGRDVILKCLLAVRVSETEFITATAFSPQEICAWLTEHKAELREVTVKIHSLPIQNDSDSLLWVMAFGARVADGKLHMRRAYFREPNGIRATSPTVPEYALRLVRDIEQRLRIQVAME